MVATLTSRRTRIASPARWQKALQRAFDQGVTVRQLQCGVWVATSGTDTEAAYAVTLHDCECRAAQEGDPVCKHRAALAHHLGYLDVEPEPEPPAPAAPPAVVRCPDCKGDGIERMYYGGYLSDYIPVTCHTCKGAGTVPAPAVPTNVIPFPTRGELDTATAERAIAYIERMAARYGDEPADVLLSA